MINILFICHGNICRSPAAEFLAKDAARKRGIEKQLHIESAGTSMEEYGNPVYPPVRRYLASKGIGCSEKRAVKVQKSDLLNYDYIVCMEETNVRNLERMFPDMPMKNVYKLLDFATFEGKNIYLPETDIEDPWYTDNFEKVFSQINLGVECMFDVILTEN